MWWLSRRIRAERELCCDEIAVSLASSRVEYARALTLMAEWKAVPILAMAANRGPLSRRVLHILGRKSFGAGPRMLRLSGSALLLTAALAAANALFGIAYPIPAAHAKESLKTGLGSALSSGQVAVDHAVRQALHVTAAKTADWGPRNDTSSQEAILVAAAQVEAANTSQPSPQAPPMSKDTPAMTASAQGAEPTETVTVTASRSREVFHKFANAFIVPTRFTEKVARWERRLCPVVTGQNPHFTAFITQHLKYVALAAGAPVNTDASCTPNIEIVFTATPQTLLDNVRLYQSNFLGYADTNSQREKLATVTRPIQAWYTTESRDMKGRWRVDSGGHLDNGVVATANATGDVNSDPNGNGIYQAQGLQGLPAYAVTGGRIEDGLHAGFNHILIVIDSTKLAGQNIVPLADYISMLALTQLNSLDACQQLPSIVNKLAAGCDHAGDGLTQFDLAYLQGLYNMNVDRKLIFQVNDIASTMADKLPHQLTPAALK